VIHFALRCREAGHRFDGWFRSNSDFEAQSERGLVECPACGSHQIEKALMRPALARGGSARDAIDEVAAPAASQDNPPTVPSPAGPPAQAPQRPPTLTNLPEPSAAVAQAFKVLQELSRKVRTEADYVGSSFAEEARKIHYGETEARQIYGEASKKDVESLREEGIAALPLVPLPEDKQ